MTPPTPPPSGASGAATPETEADEFDRHRRRVLWSLTTGLYLVGSRSGDEVNLMTANLVVQVSMEPKLVAVALERESVTARLVRAGEAFTLTVLARADRDVVRRFVKPVVEVERAPDGTVTSMSRASRRGGRPRARCPSWPRRRAICCAVSSGSTSWAATTSTSAR